MTGAKILLIDDEASIRKTLSVALELSGYQVLEATTGKQGLKAAADHRPDLIVLDLGLPDFSGKEVLDQLRTWCQVPVLILTVKAEEALKVALLEAGADDYVTKPFGTQEFLARVKVALRHTFSHHHQDRFSSGGLEIHYLARTVKWQGEDIKLTHTEYDLLKLLCQQEGQVLTQRQLLREIWGPNLVEHYHYLRIYVAQLRKKMKGIKIMTESGVGYRLILSEIKE